MSDYENNRQKNVARSLDPKDDDALKKAREQNEWAHELEGARQYDSKWSTQALDPETRRQYKKQAEDVGETVRTYSRARKK